MEPSQKFDFAVIGGGIYGLSIAYFLAKNQYSVALFEKFTIGHSNGSSHGSSRISRGLYTDKLYMQLHKLAIKEYWPLMEKQLQTKLLFSNQFMFLIQDEQFLRNMQQTIQKESRFIQKTPQQAETYFSHKPNISKQFKIIIDKEAAIIGAQNYSSKLYQSLKNRPNVVIFQNTSVKDIRHNPKNVLIETQSQIFSANKIVVSSGRWMTELLPQLSDLVKIVPQTVAYLQMKQQACPQVGRYPSFVHLKDGINYYGLPDIRHKGIKFGQHRCFNTVEQSPQTLQKNLEKEAKKMFGDSMKKVEYFQRCYYTVTKSQGFIIDWYDPENQRVLVCSCCSGHGFKFTPLIGKIVSDLLTNDKSIQIFQKHRHTFQIPYHRGINIE